MLASLKLMKVYLRVDVEEVYMNGQTYVVAKGTEPNKGVAIIHSASCKCNK